MNSTPYVKDYRARKAREGVVRMEFYLPEHMRQQVKDYINQTETNPMLLTYNDLMELIDQGVIDAPYESVNGASIDITIGPELLIEGEAKHVVDLEKRQGPYVMPEMMGENGYILRPGEFILAHSQEMFNLPDNIACEYKLKSTLARAGLGHALAGWCDPGWNNARLTLELRNDLRNHPLRLRAGMKIGQMVFFRGRPVPEERSYRVRGQYNGDQSVASSKSLK
jgi:dCTP deaminase